MDTALLVAGVTTALLVLAAVVDISARRTGLLRAFRVELREPVVHLTDDLLDGYVDTHTRRPSLPTSAAGFAGLDSLVLTLTYQHGLPPSSAWGAAGLPLAGVPVLVLARFAPASYAAAWVRPLFVPARLRTGPPSPGSVGA